MNGNRAIIIFFSILILFLVLFAPYASDTELFTPKQVPGTEQNLNPDSLLKESSENSGEALSMMQDFLELSGTAIVNIRYQNIEDAKDDIDEYAALLRQYNSLMINLDMTESEIEEYRRNNGDEIEILEKLAEEVGSLDEMKTLQIQYHDSDDPDNYYSITYNLSKLRKEIADDKTKLSEIIDKKINFSEKFEIDTEKQTESAKEIQYIGDEGDSFEEIAPTETSTPTIPHTPTPVSTTVTPEITAASPTTYETKSPTPVNTEDGRKNDETEELLFEIAILAAIGVLLLSGRTKHLRKKRRKETKSPQPSQIPDEVGQEPAGREISDEFFELLSEGPENEAYRLLSKHLFQTIATRKNVNYRPSMTNREFISSLPADDELDMFSGLYERIVYSGRSSDNDRSELYSSYQRLMKNYGGGL